MVGCERCAAVYHRLEMLHERVAALVPLPAAAQLEPGLLERGLQKTTDAIASLKQYATHTGGQAKQQLVDAADQAKQHAAAGYSRAVEYTPLASARPGAAATAIAGCLALGGGAAGYCIDKGVDPISGLVEVVQPSPAKPAQARPEHQPADEQPPDPPQLGTAAPTPAPPEAEPAPPRSGAAGDVARPRPAATGADPAGGAVRRARHPRPDQPADANAFRAASRSRRPRPGRAASTCTDHDPERSTDAHHQRPDRAAGHPGLRAHLAAGDGGARRGGHLHGERLRG